ncbi:RDD family protein [Haloplasma contractile]|uniref:RDD domain containing protein n=1 Tax=Haloplasma contractile SSD-17B TaxID=1033810 RepID=U2DUP8_9MOLU|nr:RDD family protein [Haloplasma contractile]ERJ12132.1 RDD domain containing protein [Haloplasma contractile SSD-17B]
MFELLDNERLIWWKRIKSRYLFPSGAVRIGARILDFTILYSILMPLVLWEQMVLYHIEYNNLRDFSRYYEFSRNNTIIFLVLIIILELIIPLITKGQTLGKMITKQRVISKDGEYASAKQLVGRSLIYIVALSITQLKSLNSQFMYELDTRLQELGIVKILEYGFNTIIGLSVLCLFITKYHRTIYGYYTKTCVVYDRYYHKHRDQMINKSS